MYKLILFCLEDVDQSLKPISIIGSTTTNGNSKSLSNGLLGEYSYIFLIDFK